MKTYVVFIGRIPGIYERWDEVSTQVKGYPGNKYKGYDTYDDAVKAWEKFEETGETPY
jgi:viroplasmin and RNaseH domain-containing protein